MITRAAHAPGTGRSRCSTAMRDELAHALVEALYELDVLPADEDAALVGIFAVIDDLHEALTRTEAIGFARSA